MRVKRIRCQVADEKSVSQQGVFTFMFFFSNNEMKERHYGQHTMSTFLTIKDHSPYFTSSVQCILILLCDVCLQIHCKLLIKDLPLNPQLHQHSYDYLYTQTIKPFNQPCSWLLRFRFFFLFFLYVCGQCRTRTHHKKNTAKTVSRGKVRGIMFHLDRVFYSLPYYPH